MFKYITKGSDYVVEIKDVIDALSNQYREGKAKEIDLTKNITQIRIALKDEKITQKGYQTLFSNAIFNEKELERLKLYNNGLCDARETVMNFWKE